MPVAKGVPHGQLWALSCLWLTCLQLNVMPIFMKMTPFFHVLPILYNFLLRTFLWCSSKCISSKETKCFCLRYWFSTPKEWKSTNPATKMLGISEAKASAISLLPTLAIQCKARFMKVGLRLARSFLMPLLMSRIRSLLEFTSTEMNRYPWKDHVQFDHHQVPASHKTVGVINNQQALRTNLQFASLCICWNWGGWQPPCVRSRCHGPEERWREVCRHTFFYCNHLEPCLLSTNTQNNGFECLMKSRMHFNSLRFPVRSCDLHFINTTSIWNKHGLADSTKVEWTKQKPAILHPLPMVGNVTK